MEISLCMPGLHHIKIMDTRQVCEYSESTVLTILKWRMITTLNRKLLESRGYRITYEVHIGHFFYNVNATVRFGNRLTFSIFRFKSFSSD